VTGASPAVHGICGNYFYDRVSEREVMMNAPELLRAPTLFEAFQKNGLRIGIVTAKDKLRGLLGAGLAFGDTGSVCFSAEHADQATYEENGIDRVPERLNRPLPSVYSADLSEFVFAAGVMLMKTLAPDVLYLSTTDYIQHKYPPGSDGANAFYAMMDNYWAQLEAFGALVALTADHGMNAKHRADGTPDVIYLQSFLDERFGVNTCKVILPITDPYVVHHGALGSFASVYCSSPNDLRIAAAIRELPGIECVLTAVEAAQRFELPVDRIGDLNIIAKQQQVIGTSPDAHDLSGLEVPLRSHGGISEQRVPLILSQPITKTPHETLRNFDLFDLALNHTPAPD
jgi:phosphonoacetate hydrolase